MLEKGTGCSALDAWHCSPHNAACQCSNYSTYTCTPLHCVLNMCLPLTCRQRWCSPCTLPLSCLAMSPACSWTRLKKEAGRCRCSLCVAKAVLVCSRHVSTSGDVLVFLILFSCHFMARLAMFLIQCPALYIPRCVPCPTLLHAPLYSVHCFASCSALLYAPGGPPQAKMAQKKEKGHCSGTCGRDSMDRNLTLHPSAVVSGDSAGLL